MQIHRKGKQSGPTFDLPADLGQVGHPFEDFGVSCLVSVRGLPREITAEVISHEGNHEATQSSAMTSMSKVV